MLAIAEARVRAELNISHKQGRDMAVALVGIYGPHDQAALEASSLWRNAPETAKSIKYATRVGGLIAMAEFVGMKRAVVYVESSGGRLREGAAGVLGDIRTGAKAIKPKLTELTLFDEAANDTIATAGAGIRGALRQEELFVPIATGVLTALVIAGVMAFGHGSVDFLYGSIVALGVAIISVIRLIVQSTSKKLVWR
jgi:hypothetical protein